MKLRPDHSCTVSRISKKDVKEEGNKHGGLLTAAHSFSLIMLISPVIDDPQPHLRL